MINISWSQLAPGSCPWDAIQLLPNSKVMLKHLVPSLRTWQSSEPKNMEHSCAPFLGGRGGGAEIGDDGDLKALLPATSAEASPGSELAICCVRTSLFTLVGKSRNLLRKTAQSSPCSLLLQITFQQKMILTFLVTNEKPFNSMC